MTETLPPPTRTLLRSTPWPVLEAMHDIRTTRATAPGGPVDAENQPTEVITPLPPPNRVQPLLPPLPQRRVRVWRRGKLTVHINRDIRNNVTLPYAVLKQILEAGEYTEHRDKR